MLEHTTINGLCVYKIVCNACGGELPRNDFGYFDDCLTVEKRWGYHSEYDGQTHIFHICPDCYDKMVDKFAIKPLVVDAIVSG